MPLRDALATDRATDGAGRGRRHAAFLLLNLAVIAMLLGLGAWQLHRMEWKRGLIERMSERLAAEPVPVGDVARRLARGEDVEFLRAEATGRFRRDREQYLFTSQGGEPGWQVIAPFETEDGGAVLVDRGFVPDRLKDPMSRPERTDGPVRIVGVARTHAGMTSMFAPADEPGRGVWYSWSPARMAANAGMGEGTGFVLHVEPTPDAPPWPRPARIDASAVPDNHFQYALTWFSLAACLIGLTLYQLHRLRRP